MYALDLGFRDESLPLSLDFRCPDGKTREHGELNGDQVKLPCLSHLSRTVEGCMR